MVDLSKKIQETWGILEKNSEPSEFRGVINLEFSFLHNLVVSKNINEINKLLKLFHAGSLIIIKNSFNIEDLNFIRGPFESIVPSLSSKYALAYAPDATDTCKFVPSAETVQSVCVPVLLD